MRLIFVHHVREDRGSAQDIYNYSRVARTLGHEVVLYAPEDKESSFERSLKIGSIDAVVFIFEWTTDLLYGDWLDLVRLLGKVPRQRRVVIDCDGNYNDRINLLGDCNHRDAATSRRWIDICDSLSDKICQPTLHPLRSNVRTFFFHAYNPAWEVPLELSAKPYGMVYVGNNWYRWRALRRVLDALQPIRERVGRIGLVGHGWDAPAPWANRGRLEESYYPKDAYYSDRTYLRNLDIEVKPAIPFTQVIDWMSKAVFNPVIYRPLFSHLRLVTCRTFETVAASTIPLFGLDESYVREIYGERAVELGLSGENPQEKVLDVLQRPEHYADIVMDIREHLALEHSYAVRFQELIEIVES